MATPELRIGSPNNPERPAVLSREISTLSLQSSPSMIESDLASQGSLLRMKGNGSKLSNTYTNTTVSDRASLHQGNVYGSVTHIYNSDASVAEEDQMKAKVMNTLFVTDPRDDRLTLIERKGKRVPGTCSWILDNPKYKAWLAGEAGTACLRILGDKGQGKTMLSIFLTEELDKMDDDVVYFFCDNQYQNRNSAQMVLRGCLYQMFRHRPELIKHGVTHYDELRRSETSVSTLLTICENVVKDSNLPRTTCIIDGIDECTEESFEAFARGLASILSKELPYQKRRFKVIILSRNSHTLNAFRNFPLIDLSTERDSSDIERVISTRLDQLSHVGGFNQSFRDKVHQKLLEKSGGTFLWVGCVMDELLRMRTTTDIWETLDRLPKSLPKTYTEILKQVEPRKADLLARIIGFVSVAARSLDVEELTTMFPESEQDASNNIITWKQRIRDHVAICSLTKVVEGQVMLIHQSAREFLLDEEACREVPGFHINDKKAHFEIATRCMSYLHALGQFSASYAENRFSLKRYAIAYWAYHAKRAGSRCAELLEHNHDFLQDADTLIVWLKNLKHTGPGDVSSLVVAADGKTLSLLHLAAYLGLAPWITYFLDNEKATKWNGDAHSRGFKTHVFSLTDSNTLRQTPIFNAVQEGHEDVVKLLLSRPEVHIATDTDKWTNTPLHYATSKAIVDLLVQAGAMIDAVNEDGNTPLMEAAKRDEEVTVALLEAGANVYLANSQGFTALHCASNQSISDELLKRGAKVNAVTKDGFTPLHYCELGVQADLLVRNGADATIKTAAGDTPLHLAANDAVIQAIVSKSNVDVNATNNEGDAALHNLVRACSTDSEALIELLLLKHKVNVSQTNKYGCTPMHEFARNTHILDGANIFNLLLAHGADINAKTTATSPDKTVLKGETPLIAAVRAGNLDVVQKLLACGEVDIKTQDDEVGWTALHHAACVCSTAIVTVLLDAQSDVNALCWGYTALHLALGAHRLEVTVVSSPKASPMISAAKSPRIGMASPKIGANTSPRIDATTSTKAGARTSTYVRQSSLQQEIQPEDKIGTLELLLERGADVKAQDILGRAPIFIATVALDLDAAKLLVAYKADVMARRDKSQLSILHQVINSTGSDINANDSSDDGGRLSTMHTRRLAMVRFYLDLDVPVDIKDAEGKTPLHDAARLGQVDFELLGMLLERGADVNAVRADGKTLIQAAAGKKCYHATQYLIEHGADSSELAIHHVSALQALKVGGQIWGLVHAQEKTESTPKLTRFGNSFSGGIFSKDKVCEEVVKDHVTKGETTKKEKAQSKFGKMFKRG